MTTEQQTKFDRIKAACRKVVELAAKATDGPWLWQLREDDDVYPGSVFATPRTGHAYAVAMCPRYGVDQFKNDAAFIAHARTFEPAAARALLKAVEHIEHNLRNDENDTTWWALFESIVSTIPEEAMQ